MDFLLTKKIICDTDYTIVKVDGATPKRRLSTGP